MPHETGPEPRRPQPAQGRQGGVPDGLLLAVLAFLLGLALFTWTATGISGLLSHGAWPDGVTFGRTPPALRELITEPHDLAGAWPGTPPSQLSGYGLFWGIFIGHFLVLTVLTVFVLGTVARARAARVAHRARKQHLTETRQSPDSPQPDTEPRAPTAAPSLTKQPPTGAEAADPSDDARLRILDAPGAVLVATDDPALWAGTKDARAKIGPVHLFDPTHLCDTPDRLRWSPHHGCADRSAATSRAAALLAPLRSPRPIDATTHTAAETLLRCWLQAAALDERPFREVHRWAQAGTPATDPVQTLRTHPKAAPGTAGELESLLTGHPRLRQDATELVRTALSPLERLHVRDSCTAHRADRVALESFLDELGTLYVVGNEPQTMPLLNALTQCVVEHGRRMAARSSPGRLDPPLTTVLPLPGLDLD